MYTSRTLGTLFLLLACAAPLGCGALVASMVNTEDKDWLAGFAKKYNDTAAAAKKQSESVEAYFNAVILAQDCSDSSHGQLEEGWTVETVDGPMTVEAAEKKCAQMMEAIRKKGTSEEACGYASLLVKGGQQHAGTTEWTTSVAGYRNYDATDRKGFYHSGSRQLVPCEQVPAKGNAPPPIWKQEHLKVADDFCEKGSIIVYTGTDWKIDNVTSGDERYLERSLEAQCWYPKGPIGQEFSVPPACEGTDAPPDGNHSCITAAGKLVVK